VIARGVDGLGASASRAATSEDLVQLSGPREFEETRSSSGAEETVGLGPSAKLVFTCEQRDQISSSL
jgi:hypothetical protein